MAHSISKSAKDLNVTGIGLDENDLPPFDQGPIDLKQWFDKTRQNHPFEFEIGSGKGTFLLQQASQVPDVNYIGLEYARTFWRYGADRIRRHGLKNVRMLPLEADFFVRNYVPDQYFRQVHIYFPDPWPKKRHHKRRLIQTPFLKALHRILYTPNDSQSAGTIRIATDHTDYFHWMQDHASQVADWFETLDYQSPESAGEGELVGTNFERKYRREGRPFHGMILRKKAH